MIRSHNSRRSEIKQAQRESLLFREISSHMTRLIAEEPALDGVWITRVSLSSDGSVCSIFVHTHDAAETFSKKLGHLILYKPSLRTCLAKASSGRYTPNIIFKLDPTIEKQQAVHDILHNLRASGEL